MTALPSLTLPNISASPQALPSFSMPSTALPGEPGTPERAAHIDGLVAVNRSKTSMHAIDQRNRPRLSISELNDMDTDELKSRFLNTGPEDTRTPVQKILDIIDLPRNTNANILFGHPTTSGILGSYLTAAGEGAAVGGAIGGGAGLFTGGALSLPAAGIGALAGAAAGTLGTAATQIISGLGRAFGTGSAADDITNAKESGALGQPRIFTSDALKQMGVNNRVASALLGFVGDVAMDPLTYAGGEGFGIEAGGKTLRSAASGAIKQADKEAALGGVHAITNPTIRDVMVKAGQATGQTAEGDVGKTILGDVNKGIKARVFRTLGGDLETTGGVIEKYANAEKTPKNIGEHETIDSVRKLIGEFGRGTGPGIKIGDAGSQIFHLPFGGLGPMPSWTVQVPAFTATGRKTLRQFELAKAIGDHALASETPITRAAGDAVASMQTAMDGFTAANDQHLENLGKLHEAVDASPGARNADLETQINGLNDAHKKTIEDFGNAVADDHMRVNQALDDHLADPRTLAALPSNVDTLLYLGEQSRQSEAILQKVTNLRKVADDRAAAIRNIRAMQSSDVQTAAESWNRLAALDQAEKMHGGAATTDGLPINVGDYVDHAPSSGKPSMGTGGLPVEKILRTDDGILHAVVDGKTVPAHDLQVVKPKGLVDNGNIMLSIEDQAKVDALKSEIGEINKRGTGNVFDRTFTEEDGQQLDKLYSQLDSIQRPYLNRGSAMTSGLGDTARTYRGLGNIKVGADGKPILNADPAVQNRVFESIRPILDGIEDASTKLSELQKGANTGLTGDILKGQQPLYQGAEEQTGATIAHMNDLSSTLADLRKRLYEETAPLREGPHQTLDEFREGIKQRSVQRATQAQQDIWKLHERDPSGAEKIAEAYQTMTNDALIHRRVIQGTIGAHLTKDHRDVLEVVKNMLGTSDDAVAASTLGQMATSAWDATNTSPGTAAKFLQAIDRSYRPLFGSRYGLMGEEIARIRAKQNGAQGVANKWVYENIERPLKAAASNAGLSDKLDDVMVLLTGMQQKARNDASGATGMKFPTQLPDANGNMQPTLLIPRMQELMDKLRAAGPDTADKFFQDLNGIVTTSNAQLDSLKDAEMRDYILEYAMPDLYTPHVMSPVGQNAVKPLRGDLGWLPSGGGSSEPIERSQMMRTTHAYVFPDFRPDREGKFEMFMEKDRWTRDAQEMNRLKLNNPELWAKAMEKKDVIERYDRLVNKPGPVPVDLYTLNQKFRDKEFGPLSVGEGQSFFDERWPVIMARRLAMHERSMARQDALALASKVALPIPEKLWLTMAGAAKNGDRTFQLPGTGENVTVAMAPSRLGNKESVPVLYARGQTFRRLSPQMKSYENNPIARSFTEGFDNVVVPEWAADAAEDITRAWSNEKWVQNLAVLDKATSAYKSMTLFHPSWFINNLVGHLTMLSTGDVNPAAWLKHLPTAIKIRRFSGNPEELAKIVGNVRGQAVDGNALSKMAAEYSTFEHNLFSEQLQNMMRDKARALPTRMSDLPFKDGLSTDYNFRVANGLGLTGKPGAALGILGDRLSRHVVEPFFRANGFVQDSARLAGAMALMEHGNDAPAAFDKIRRIMYDFQDFTGFEQNAMRKMIPFYSWAKNNLSYQVRMLFQHPQYMNLFPKVQNALEEGLDGDQRIPMSSRPEWMRQMLAIQMGDTGYMPLTSIPTLEALQAVQGVTGSEGAMETAKYGTGYLNPLLTFAPQLAAQKEFYTGRSIGTPETGGDMSIGEFLAGQVRPLSEYGPGGKVQRAFEQGGPVRGIERAVAGGRLQPMDSDTIARFSARDLRGHIENARKSMSRAEARGDKGVSLQMRVRILKLYDRAIKAGLEKDVSVPRWAKDTLAHMQEAK